MESPAALPAAVPTSPPVAAAAPEARSLLGRARPLVLARLVTAALTFCIPLVLARVLALDEYGAYKQLLLVAQTLYHVLPFGVAQALYFFLPRAEERRPWLAQTLLYLLAAGAAAALLAYFGLPWLGALFRNPHLVDLRLPLALYAFGLLGAFSFEHALTAQGRTGTAARVYLTSDALRTLAMVVPLLLGLGLRGLFWGMALFTLGRTAVAWWVLLGRERGPLWRPGLFRRQLAYALPFGLSVVVTITGLYAHQFAVSASVPPEAFALYAVACFQLPLVDLLYSPVSEVLMVRLGELEHQGRRAEAAAHFRDAAEKLSTLFFPLATFLFAAAPELIGALFGPRFLPAANLFRLTVLGTVFASFPADAVLRGSNHTPSLLRIALLKLCVVLPALWLGLRTLGLAGALLSVALSETVGFVALLAAARRALGTSSARALLPLGGLAARALAAAGAGAGVLGAHALAHGALERLPPDFLWRALPLAAAGLLFLPLYLALLALQGVSPGALLAGLLGHGPARAPRRPEVQP